MSVPICKACTAQDGLRVFQVKEMMYGLRHVFDYGECLTCGSIQIMQVPGNLSEYYPDDYYSYQPPSSSGKTMRQWFAQQRQEHANGRVNRFGRFLTILFGPPLTAEVNWARLAGIRPEHRVLDVGCGNGAMLAGLRKDGFKNLTGVDPYMRTEVRNEGFVLLRKELRDIDGQFDSITLHHSFEHMPNPFEALQEIHRLLDPAGVAVICTPVAGCYAWRTYGANWFQLDAPRHLFIPSDKGFRILAERAGFNIDRVVYNSTYVQFPASDQYARGIPLRTPDDKRYTRREMLSFADRARMLNEAKDGDQAGFILRETSQV